MITQPDDLLFCHHATFQFVQASGISRPALVRVTDERRCRHAGEQGGQEEKRGWRAWARGWGEVEKSVSFFFVFDVDYYTVARESGV